MKSGTLLLSIALCLPTAPLLGQGGTTDAWPTYAGDYSQRRYSPLRQIDQTNVRHLTLAWLRRLTAGPGGGEGAWFGPPPGPPAITGGVAEEPMTMPGATSGSPRLAGSILQVNGILYISSPDHAGAGDDLDAPGFLQSFDPKTGELQWKFYTVPMNQGDPGLETWASLDAARHGGAQVWTPGSYDPATHLYIFGTGNPTPAYTAMLRAPRDEHTNLYTCSVVALNVDTGKMAWYFQTSPNDTHDWDATQAPVLFDGMFAGKPRKMTMQASRNGYVFVLDRTNGKHLLTAK